MAKTKKKAKDSTRDTWIAFSLFLLIVAAIVCVVVLGGDKETKPQRNIMSTEFMGKAPPCPFSIDGFTTVAGCPLGMLNKDLKLTCVGRFGEDNVLAALVENVGTATIVHTELKINVGGLDAFFTITDLPTGSSVLMIEDNRLPYAESAEFKMPLALGFEKADESVSTDFSDVLDVAVEHGSLTLTNRSTQILPSPIEISCGNRLAEGLYFNIHRLTVEAPLAPGESYTLTTELDETAQVVCVRYE